MYKLTDILFIVPYGILFIILLIPFSLIFIVERITSKKKVMGA
tara:strand:- start:400 stop:528 length:129 start_codon:yes stop_codon:yes gene_type:complete